MRRRIPVGCIAWRGSTTTSPGRLDEISLYERFFPTAAAVLATLDRAAEAETIPTPIVDRLDLLVVRRSG